MAPNILIADDYEDNRELLRLILLTADYNVREAEDGRECLRMAMEQPPDLIMIDLAMPLLDGWRVCKELKANQRTRNIPCVAVTASADPEGERTLKAGFDGYLPKPFRREDLLGLVDRLLTANSLKTNVAGMRDQK
jgi:CheY-like chemotaxis protein